MKRFELVGVYILNLLAMSFWGISFVWIKIVYEFYNPFTILFFRMVISACILFLISSTLMKEKKRLERRHIPMLMALAFCEPFMYFIGESLGLLYISSTVASLIVSTIPIFMVFASFIFFKERIDKRQTTGLALAIIGILALVFDTSMNLRYEPKGILLMFLAVISAIGFNILGTKLVKTYRPITLIKYQNVFGAIYFFPLFLIYSGKELFTRIPPSNIILCIFNLSLFSSALSYLFYLIAIEKIGINKANIFTYTIPLFTAIFAYFLIGEEFDITKSFGMIFIVSGIFISQYKGKFKRIRFLFRRGS
ncbi:MAG: hypothetical protein C0601_06320 [Candidatus Muiribacterium halophilum]|uniref:EamA domain-containing protein n=1 Tax=Muiribacterium halophilum TaxID=2053465 RepID=A0A2N5ZG00_MUIH1|nr:MAG: hypothetical protein C0601_06320 [Candidatus Muirbacterium halophilum]